MECSYLKMIKKIVNVDFKYTTQHKLKNTIK